MLSTIFTKAVRDRWLTMAVAAAALGGWFFLAMAIYRDIDLSVYTDLPEAVRELMGIPDGADAASLSYNVVMSFAAAVTLAGLAISMGSAAIAGEERNGTIGLLLGNPKSRTHVMVSKAAAMVLLIAVISAVLWGFGRVVPAILGVEIGETHIGAMVLHLGVNAAFYGFLALTIGAWTGRRSLASGVSAGVMILSFFAVGLLPLVDSIAGVARVFPWYYFDSSAPLVNGIRWGHLAVLLVGCFALATTAFVGVNRRDLRADNAGVTLLDRLRDNPRTRQVFDRLAGSTRVSRLWIKTVSEHQGLLVITAGAMFGIMGLLMGPMYNAVEDSLAAAADQFPEELMAIAGGGDMSTPEGFFEVETFSLMAPIAIMVVTVVIGARGLAGEEANNTMGLLLANPIKRSTIVAEQAVAMTVYALIVGAATFAGVALGSVVSGLGLSIAGIAATSILVTLLGLVFGALALALSAATGRVKVAVYGTIAVALTSHLLNSFLPLSDRLAGYAKWTPSYYYLSSDPLINGMHWSHAGLLTGLIVVLLIGALVAFERRDLRQR